MKKLTVILALLLSSCTASLQEPPTTVPTNTPLPTPTTTLAPTPEEAPVNEIPPPGPQNQPQLPPIKGGNTIPNIGQPFWIPVGQTAELEVDGAKYAITFLEVTEDSRCPQGAQCIVAGNVGVKLSVSKDGGEAVEVILSRGDVGETQPTVQFEAISMTLNNVAPLASVGEAVDPATYHLELLIVHQ
ncbi:MAG: hypothetical protein DWQ07_08405 [Chloroflexi bacterium]|nr:MAG: hypothetical protein DWQ07_08405 [Chloroflexota bacterium]MBL1193267.1 hypothetical protein [Chloroflexota bacterium]NOH10560.1 hypothetical protein [Chloroflexota bacterium]